jgi:hypothetical protein
VTGLKTLFAAIAGIAAAVALTVLYRSLGREARTASDEAHATQEATLAARSTSRDNAEPESAASDSPVGPLEPSRSERDLAWQTELRDASESFRNSSLLIAIRENGFPCADVTNAAQGGEPLGGWRVTCRGALVYLVAVAENGQLVVEPMPIGDNFLTSPFNAPPQEFPNPLTPPNPQRPPNR